MQIQWIVGLLCTIFCEITYIHGVPGKRWNTALKTVPLAQIFQLKPTLKTVKPLADHVVHRVVHKLEDEKVPLVSPEIVDHDIIQVTEFDGILTDTTVLLTTNHVTISKDTLAKLIIQYPVLSSIYDLKDKNVEFSNECFTVMTSYRKSNGPKVYVTAKFTTKVAPRQAEYDFLKNTNHIININDYSGNTEQDPINVAFAYNAYKLTYTDRKSSTSGEMFLVRKIEPSVYKMMIDEISKLSLEKPLFTPGFQQDCQFLLTAIEKQTEKSYVNTIIEPQHISRRSAGGHLRMTDLDGLQKIGTDLLLTVVAVAPKYVLQQILQNKLHEVKVFVSFAVEQFILCILAMQFEEIMHDVSYEDKTTFNQQITEKIALRERYAEQANDMEDQTFHQLFGVIKALETPTNDVHFAVIHDILSGDKKAEYPGSD